MEQKFLINKIYFIVSLDGECFRAAEDLYTETIINCFIDTQFIVVQNSTELYLNLDKIVEETDKESFPLVHIEAHGDENAGLILLNKEIVNWNNLSYKFEEINKACCNNLSIALAACSSAYIAEEMIKSFLSSLDTVTPFNILVGTSEDLEAPELFQSFKIFYHSLNEDRDLKVAARKMNKLKNVFVAISTLEISENLLVKFLENFIRNISLNANKHQLKMFYLGLCFFTYQEPCSEQEFPNKLCEEKFYVDFFNRKIDVFLMRECNPELAARFPKVESIVDFKNYVERIKRNIGNLPS